MPTRQSAQPFRSWSNNCSSTPRIARHSQNKPITSATAPGGSSSAPSLRPKGASALLYWVYVCNTLSEDGVSFEEASEAVAFIAGHYLADEWHQEMNEKIEAAQQQSDEDEASHLTQPE